MAPADKRPGSVRIIGGSWRGRRLELPRGSAVRPTPDRVRETVFNWLGADIAGRDCLDLYAGSGAFGFEAMSRGARSVIFVEKDPRLAGALEAHATLLGASGAVVLCADAERFVTSRSRSDEDGKAGRRSDGALPDGAAAAPVRYGLIFLDPPYTTSLDPLLAPVLGMLDRNGLIYVERPAVEGLPDDGRLVWHRQSRAGRIVFGLARAA